ncbi:MAG: hypothetical protein M3019_04810 [Candidatus Dormibacteraeota bacterium]|nr:hypothetical protein [Candidatus Dormibacteraeota bacterium]
MVLALVALLAPGEMGVAGEAQDEGAFVLYPQLVLHGAVAQRDFQTYYGPGFSWLVAAGYLVGGASQAVERLVSLVVIALVGLTLVALVARIAPRGVAIISALVVLPLAWSFPLAGPWLAATALAVGSLLALCSSTDRPLSRSMLVLGGMLAALSLSFRPDMVPAIALSALPLILGRRSRAFWYGAGATLGIIPLAVHVLVATPSNFFQHFLVDAIRASPGRVLPVPPVGAVDRVAFVLALGSVALALAAAVTAWRRWGGTGTSRALASVALLSVGFLIQALQRDDAVHTVTAEIVAIGWVPVSLWILLPLRRVGEWRHRVGLLAAVVALGCGTVAATAIRINQSAGISVSNQGRAFVVHTALAADTQAALREVDRVAKPGQSIFVGPADLRRTNYDDTFLYFLLPQLRPGTRYLEMEPLNANRSDSGLASDMARTDVLVLTSTWDSWSEPNRSSQLGSSVPNEIVDKHFCAVALVGPYRVLIRCTP